MNIAISRILLVLALFLTGCVASGPAGLKELPQKSGYGSLYIFRESKFPAAGITEDIFVDGIKVGTLPNGSYLLFYVPAGKHKVEARFSLINRMWYKDASIEVSVDQDTPAYTKLDLTMTSLTYGANSSSTWSTGFENSSPENARATINLLKINNSDFDVFANAAKLK